MKKFIMGGAAVLLALGGVAIVAGPTQAHTPHITDDCASGVHLTGTNYDSHKVNTWSIDIGSEHHEGTFGASVDVTFPVPQDGATTHVVASIADANHTKAYSESIDENVGPCGTPPVDVCKNLDGNQATIPDGLIDDGQGNCVTPPVDVCANIDGVQTSVPEGLIQDGDNCIEPPVPAQQCVVGASYHETDDNLGVTTDAGIDIRSQGDGKATDGGGFLVTGNAQGITDFNWTEVTDANTINGIFGRFIFDLSSDGGSSYNSFSGLGTHVDQSTVAGYGSKAVFSGKTLADVATTWPHNKLVAIIWQTGSSYAKGDGALLTGYSGVCGEKSFIVTSTPTPTPTPTPTTPVTNTQLQPVLAETGMDSDTAWLIFGGGLGLILVGVIAFQVDRHNRQRREMQDAQQ